jgi:hypothetical protein
MEELEKRETRAMKRLEERKLKLGKEEMRHLKKGLSKELLEEVEDLVVERVGKHKLKVESFDNEVEFRLDRPFLKLKYKLAEEEESEFKVQFKKLVEFADLNGNGKIDEGEKVLHLNLHKRELSWRVDVENLTAPEDVEHRITYSAEVRGASITIIMHVFQHETSLTDGGADEVKVDLLISNWPWKNETNLLALVCTIEGEVEREEPIRTALVEGEDGFYLPITNETYLKYEWTPEVEADGSIAFIVNSYYRLEEERVLEEEEETFELEVERRITIVYPHFDEELKHDPSVGIEDDPQDIMILNSILAAPALPTLPTLVTPLTLTLAAIIVAAIVIAAVGFRMAGKEPIPRFLKIFRR